MTDNEIIKALECCSTNNPDCDNCPYNVFGGSRCREPEADAVNLINRLKADLIEREAILTQQAKIIKRLASENDRKAHILDSYALQYGTVADKDKLLKEAKAKAVREFADRFMENFDTYTDDEEWQVLNIKNLVDNLLQEMNGKEST